MKQIVLRPAFSAWTIILLLASVAICQGQYPFITTCLSPEKVPAISSEMTRSKTERLFQGSTMYPEGKSCSLVIQPEIVLDEPGWPDDPENGRPVEVKGILVFHILSPGDLVQLKQVEVPFYGKGMNGELAFRQAILELEVESTLIQAAYDEAYRLQEIQWNDCQSFLHHCQTFADSGRIATALVMLGSIPPGTPCSRDVKDLWESLMEQKKAVRCKELMAAAKVALEEEDDHRCLQLAIAADPDCQANAWKDILEGLSDRIPITERSDRRMLERALDGVLRTDERNGMLYAILFEQIMSPE